MANATIPPHPGLAPRPDPPGDHDRETTLAELVRRRQGILAELAKVEDAMLALPGKAALGKGGAEAG